MRFIIIDNNMASNKLLLEALQTLPTMDEISTDIMRNQEEADFYLNIRHYSMILINDQLIEEPIGQRVIALKREYEKTPLIVIADNHDSQQEKEALKAGADDYIKRPFELDILLKKIKTHLGLNQNPILEFNDLKINTREKTVHYQQLSINFASRPNDKPFEVFVYLAQHPNQIFTKQQLLEALWVEPETTTPQVIDVCVYKLKQDIDKWLGITTLETMPRLGGYRFVYPKTIQNTSSESST